jgi:hypothetical protein
MANLEIWPSEAVSCAVSSGSCLVLQYQSAQPRQWLIGRPMLAIRLAMSLVGKTTVNRRRWASPSNVQSQSRAPWTLRIFAHFKRKYLPTRFIFLLFSPTRPLDSAAHPLARVRQDILLSRPAVPWAEAAIWWRGEGYIMVP